ncbi:MAG: hypothetical protein HY319_08625 [Armatimonadetes bacterium]|nr:hypothetical protein [Armatimonadota bacterium]
MADASSIGQVRVLSGRAELRPGGPSKEAGAVHTPDPSDSLSLSVQSEDTGSSWCTSRFKVRVEDLDGNPDLKVTIRQSWGKGYAVVSNSDGQGHETRVEVPIGSVGAWAVRELFTPGTARGDMYTSHLQAPDVKAIEIERDGSDGRITFLRTDGGNHGVTVGSSASLWRA